MMVRICVITILLLSLTAPIVHSAGLKVKKSAKPYEVEVDIDRNPLVVGTNRIEIGIRDASGEIVTDAEVIVNYYMPPMPRMVPMNYTTKTEPKGKKYRATMNVIMVGPWYIRIIIRHKGSTVTTKLNVDAQ
jgi:hypothetical protein